MQSSPPTWLTVHSPTCGSTEFYPEFSSKAGLAPRILLQLDALQDHPYKTRKVQQNPAYKTRKLTTNLHFKPLIWPLEMMQLQLPSKPQTVLQTNAPTTSAAELKRYIYLFMLWNTSSDPGPGNNQLIKVMTSCLRRQNATWQVLQHKMESKQGSMAFPSTASASINAVWSGDSYNRCSPSRTYSR